MVKIISLKKPTKNDLLRLMRMHNKLFPLSRWNVKGLSEYFFDKHYRPICFVIYFNKKCAGYIIGRPPPSNKRSFNLISLGIKPRYRRRGLAILLMKNFYRAVLKKKSFEKVYLHFRRSNDLEKFYSKFGFRNTCLAGKHPDGERKYYMEASRKNIEKYLKSNKKIK